MSNLNFKLRKYDQGGFLDFLTKNPASANGLFTTSTEVLKKLEQPTFDNDFSSFSSTFRSNRGRQQGIDAGANLASGVASMIPGVGTAVSAGIQGVKALSDLTQSDEDQYGVHKSGFLSTLDPQHQLRKDRSRFQNQEALDQYSQYQAAGNAIRSSVEGFKAAPYGKKGMKFGSKTKFSKPC